MSVLAQKLRLQTEFVTLSTSSRLSGMYSLANVTLSNSAQRPGVVHRNPNRRTFKQTAQRILQIFSFLDLATGSFEFDIEHLDNRRNFTLRYGQKLQFTPELS